MYAAGYGRIVNISSAHGLRASPFKSGYVAAKHGLEGLSKVAALEGGPKGVTSNCINPGYVRTPLVEQQIAAQAISRGIPESDVIDQVMLAESAVKRLVEPDEVAELAVYLLLRRSRFDQWHIVIHRRRLDSPLSHGVAYGAPKLRRRRLQPRRPVCPGPRFHPRRRPPRRFLRRPESEYRRRTRSAGPS